jgi:hypothetical protein
VNDYLDPPECWHDILSAIPASGLDLAMAKRPAMIIAERGLVWLAAFRTAVRRSHVRAMRPSWIHLDSPKQVSASLACSPSACVVIESTPQTAGGDVLLVDGWLDAYPTCCVIAAVLRPPQVVRANIELAFREAGAAAVLDSPRRVDKIVPLLARHWQRFPTTTRYFHGRSPAE